MQKGELIQSGKENHEQDEAYRNIFDTVPDGLILSELDAGLVVEANPAACSMHGYQREDFVGQPLTMFIHPDSLPEFNERVRVFHSGDTFDTPIRHRRSDHSTFEAIWHGAFFTHQGKSCLLGVVRDVSKQIQSEQLLHESVGTRMHEQAMLLDISHALASTLELQPDLILDQLRKIIKYSHGGLFAMEDSSLVTLAVHGARHLEQTIPLRIPLNAPETLSRLFNGHRPIRIPNVWADEPQADFLRSLLDDGNAVLLDDMQSWMWVPLAVKGRMLGSLGVAHEKRDYFTSHHADLALSVADQAAITMINAELYHQAQALAVLEERQRLARNLHDAVNQSLFSAGLIAEVLPRLWERDQQEGRKALEDLRRLTHGAMAEMRALLAELRPAMLIDSDLGDLLRLLGNLYTGRTNTPVAMTLSGEFSLPADVQITFYHVCQEALNNIAKHANADQVEIHLTQEGQWLELCIRDNGVGFDPAQTPTGHYGLSMMRERAESVNAQFTLTSQPGHGTELLLRWTKPQPRKEAL